MNPSGDESLPLQRATAKGMSSVAELPRADNVGGMR
jgi:hypothetical protein